MTPTLSTVVAELLAIPSPGERIPLDLLRRLVREGWADLNPNPPGAATTYPPVPAWGPGMAMLTIGVANWGVDPPPVGGDAKGSGGTRYYITDPATKQWTGPAHKSGKHLLDGGSKYPYGGLGICHLDSGGLLDAYERWGYPAPTARLSDGRAIKPRSLKSVYAPGGKPIPFDVLRKQGLSAFGAAEWRAWLAWSDGLMANPAFHEWLIGYWLREFWMPSWRATEDSDHTPMAAVRAGLKPDTGGALLRDTLVRACVNARIRNSAKGWATKWAHLPADEQAKRYIEAKREDRGESAAKRTERQVRYALRATAAIEAVRVEVV